MKSEARMSKGFQSSVCWFGHCAFVIASDFVIRHSDLAIAVCSIHKTGPQDRLGEMAVFQGLSLAQSGGFFSRYSVSPALGTIRIPSLSRFAKSSIRMLFGSR